jgi:hypothetical protein
MIIKASRSGFKTSDQVQVQGAGRSRKRSIHGYVSIYRRSATQPLGLRWGFETTSNHIAAYQDTVRPNENKYCRTELKVIKSPFWGR